MNVSLKDLDKSDTKITFN